MDAAWYDGALEIRLTRDARDIEAAQRLRYRVFVEEMGAQVPGACHAERREFDPFDAICDHLVVIDHRRSTPELPAVVGAYRMLRRSVAEANSGFYTAGEFDITRLLSTRRELAELGRSCVAPEHRSGQVVQLLWRGLFAYVERHDIDTLFGCASLPGNDPDSIAQALGWLWRDYQAPETWRPRPLPDRRLAFEPLPDHLIDETTARRQLPPLLKGYLMSGALVGEGAVVDELFKTIDVCVLLPTERLRARNRRHFAKPARVPVALAA